MEVSSYEFIKKISQDFNIDINQKHKTFLNQFPFKNGKRKINSCYDAVIVNDAGDEFPYMLSQHNRNEDKLIDFNYIYVVRTKSIEQIISELEINIKTEPCRICEGGGWTSRGTRYFYKDLICEL
jgi:hypothetical protein